MKRLPKTPFNQAVDFSLMLLLSALVIQSVAFFIGRHQISNSQLNFYSIIPLGALIISTGVAWLQMLRVEKGGFTGASVLAAVSFIAHRLMQAHANFPEMQYRTVFSPEILIAAFIAGFVAIRHFLSKWNNEKSPRYLLSGIGIALILWALTGLVCGQFSFFPAFGGLIGIGCVAREPFMGVIIYWISVVIWVVRLLAVIGLERNIPVFVGETCVLILLGIVLSIFLKEEFRWEALQRTWKEMNRPAPSRNYSTSSFQPRFSFSKSCSRCGREVPTFSHAGQRCPHCGAYWSAERQGGFRY